MNTAPPSSTVPPHHHKITNSPSTALIRHFLYHPTTQQKRPLRFSRNRYLRHWTIRRAWSLFYHNRKAARELELMRQYQSMASANEELRTGVGDGGKLFRRAMMKTGTWSIPERGGGVPLEYARPLTEWVGTVGGLGVGSKARVWDEGWKRWK